MHSTPNKGNSYESTKRGIHIISMLTFSRRDTMRLQKLGGYASIVSACIIIVNIVILAMIFRSFTQLEIYDPVKMMDAYNTYTVAFRVYYVLGILTGVLIAFIAIVLQERMQTGAPQLMRLAVIGASGYFVFAIGAEISGIYRNVVLSQINDPAAFRSFLVLHECFASISFNALGWAVLFIGWSALKTRALPRILGYIMLVYGIADIVVTVSIIELAIPIGLLVGVIVFAWLGIVLLRQQQPNLPAQETA
jgi:hypothetical protein